MAISTQKHIEMLMACEIFPHTKLLDDVVALADANSNFVGFYPREAFVRSAAEGKILGVVDRNSLLGYLLYFTARGRAVIQQLCVAPENRGRGIAKILLDKLRQKTQSLDGISLHCRRDFPAYRMWVKLGFVPIDEKRGRGRAPTTLTRFWLDNGNDNLFSETLRNELESRTLAVLDSNVVFDFADSSRPHFESSRAIHNDWIREFVELCVTDEVFREIDRNEDGTIRTNCRNFARHFRCLSPDPKRFAEVKRRLESELEASNHQDASDLCHLASAITLGARFFVTRDLKLIDRSEQLESIWKISSVTPTEFILHFDQYRRQSEYEPATLVGTAINIGRMTAADLRDATELFVSNATGEKKGDWAFLLRTALCNPDQSSCWIVKHPPDDRGIAILIIYHGEAREEVRAFRVHDTPISNTLCRQLAAWLTSRTESSGANITEVTDPHLHQRVATALHEFGFIESKFSWLKVNLCGIGTFDQRIAELKVLPDRYPNTRKSVEHVLNGMPADLKQASPADVARFESLLWPGRIDSDAIPTFVIPIRPRWAKELFDSGIAEQFLFKANPKLALNTENVYYRSAVPPVVRAPARIVWYVSEEKTLEGTGAFRAVSSLQEVVVAPAKEVYKRFKRLGVYEWSDLMDRTGDCPTAQAMAIVFNGTQLFQNPVPRTFLKSALARIGKPDPPLSTPYELPDGLFLELFEAGTKRR